MQTKPLFVRPVPGRLVRDPRTMQPLPEEGLYVERTTFWRRRLAEGDVEQADPAAATPTQPKPSRK
jgi:hypothetical protein